MKTARKWTHEFSSAQWDGKTLTELIEAVQADAVAAERAEIIADLKKLFSRSRKSWPVRMSAIADECEQIIRARVTP